MEIKNYTSFFHDGSILDVKHHQNKITISMKSAEMSEDDIVDDILLSKKDRICGKLHLEEIKNIKENGVPYPGILNMKYPEAEIFHFDLDQHKIVLEILWGSLPPKPCIDDFSTIEIEAEKIWWENIPDLETSY